MCCWQTKYSGLVATSHVVAHYTTTLLSRFRQILQFSFRENQHLCSHIKSGKNRRFCIARIIPPLTHTCAVKQPHEICVSEQHHYVLSLLRVSFSTRLIQCSIAQCCYCIHVFEHNIITSAPFLTV